MGKSLIIKGADFHANGMKEFVWDIDFSGGNSSFAQGCGSFITSTGTPYFPTLFGSRQTIKYIELGLSVPDAGVSLPSSIKVFKIDRSTNTATFITEANFTIPSKASSEKMIIDLGQNVTLEFNETIGLFGIMQPESSEEGSTIFGMTHDPELVPNVTMQFFKSNNLDYSSNSFQITLEVMSFNCYMNVRMGN